MTHISWPKSWFSIMIFNLIFEPPFHPFQGNEAVHQSFIKLQLSYPVEKILILINLKTEKGFRNSGTVVVIFNFEAFTYWNFSVRILSQKRLKISLDRFIPLKRIPMSCWVMSKTFLTLNYLKNRSKFKIITHRGCVLKA